MGQKQMKHGWMEVVPISERITGSTHTQLSPPKKEKPITPFVLFFFIHNYETVIT